MKENDFQNRNDMYESLFRGLGYIAGVDEVGVASIFGPVVAAAVILPKDFRLPGLTDSKKLNYRERVKFDKIIKEKAIAYSISEISADIIDKYNVLEASKMAMIDAVNNLKVKPSALLVDAHELNMPYLSVSIKHGDLYSISISAASVVAKVYRDKLMYKYDRKYRYLDLKNNKGYPSKKHIIGIMNYGITPFHRKTYKPVRMVIERETDLNEIRKLRS